MKIAGVKLVMDGAYSDRTAWTDDAYPGSCDHGLQTASDDDLRSAVAWARRNRVQVAVHAMGDRALRVVIDVLGDEQPWLADRPSVRLEHATLFSARPARPAGGRGRWSSASRPTRSSSSPSTTATPATSRPSSSRSPIRSGPSTSGCRTARCPPTPRRPRGRTPTTSSSRSRPRCSARRTPAPTSTRPRRSPSRRRCCSTPAGRGTWRRSTAWASSSPGFEGSFVVLDRDVFTIPPQEIDRVRVRETWLQGERVFRR